MSSTDPRPGVPPQPFISRNASTQTTAPSGPRKPVPPSQTIVAATPPIDPMLTTYQAAELLRVSPETMKKWRQRHKGPVFVRFDGGVVRYPLSSILHYLKEHTIQP